ncbi:MAG: enolase C-terminal domain-like protein [Bacteroidota bacterium]
MNLSWQIIRFNLKETFAIAYGNYSHRDALIVTLTKNNISGYGECTAIDYYQIDLLDYTQKLKEIKTFVENQIIVYPTDFYIFLLSLDLPSFLRSALDCAYWDLYGKLENKSFLELNKISFNKVPESSITISVAAIDKQIDKIEKSKWTKFKVKCSHFDENQIDCLLNMNREIGLDANGSFTVSQCQWLENCEKAKQFTYIEQPMQIGEEYYSHLKTSAFPNWMADEDCQGISNLKNLKPHYRTINIKLVKCGGLTPALQLIAEAKKMDFKIMIGCMTESTIGISAGAVLAPLVDYADLDGANLIANDIANGSFVLNGKINLSDQAGLGIKLM